MTRASRDSDPPGGIAAPVELWLLDRDAFGEHLAAINASSPLLSADEIERAAAFSDRGMARLWTAGRTALRLLLKQFCGSAIRQQPFIYTPAGRPTIAGSEIEFSVADSGRFLAVAVGRDGRIGVDIEQPRAFKMSPERIDLIVAAGTGLGGAMASPLQSWTRIEAFAKATGPSLAATLARLGVQGHGEGHLTAGQVLERARRARLDAKVGVHDLDLPHALAGAAASRRPPSALHILDAAAIDRLAG